MIGSRLRRRCAGHRTGGSVLPTIWDDNFDVGSSVDTTGARFAGAQAWTVINGMAATTSALTGGKLRVTKTTNDAVKYVILQPIPAGDFTAFTKATHTTTAGDSVQFGFWLADGAVSGFGHQYRAGLGISSTWTGNLGLGVFEDFGFIIYSATTDAGTNISPWGPYLRLSRNGTTLSLDWSSDGSSWTAVASWTSAYTLTHIGIGYAHERASAVDVLEYDFFALVNGTHHAALPGTAA